MSKKLFPKILAVLLSVCMVLSFTGCGTDPKSADNTVSQEVQNLEKLCKVWGYTKYHHPAFLLGEKDWDAELLNLIPDISEAHEDEVNDILYEWFVSLGEIDYKTSRKRNLPPEDQLLIQADTDWICKDYLGKKLAEGLSQLKEIPTISRSKSPVSFREDGVTKFSNEQLYENMDYKDTSYCLLGLFRIYNAVEYYSPYVDLMDKKWDTLLPIYIQKMMEVSDKTDYELTLLSFAAQMNDCHAMLLDGKTTMMTLGKDDTQLKLLYNQFGSNFAPVKLVTVEGQPVVEAVEDENCLLMPGDVIVKLDDINIYEVIKQRKEYIPIPNDENLSRIYPYLLTSKAETMEITVLRDGEEQTVSVAGCSQNCFYSPLSSENQQEEKPPYQITEDGIGFINFENPLEVTGKEMMDDLKNTDGLIIDMRQGLDPSFVVDFANMHRYFCEGYQTAVQIALPTQSNPGSYLVSEVKAGSTKLDHEMTGSYYYEKPVMLLVDETVVSSGEYATMMMRAGKNVTVMGDNTLGTDGNVTYLPLPGSLQMTFSSVGVYGPNKEQVQRIGIAPDIEVKPTIEGIKEGRDELKEAAIKYLTEQK